MQCPVLLLRIRKMDKVPVAFKRAFLMAINETGTYEAWEEGVVDQAFSYALWLDDSTPLPTDDLFRHETLLLHLCVEKHAALGSPLAKDLSGEQAAVNFDFYKLTQTSAVVFGPTAASTPMPGTAEMEWQLKNPESIHCVAVSGAFKGCTQTITDLFPFLTAYNPSSPWDSLSPQQVTEAAKGRQPFRGEPKATSASG